MSNILGRVLNHTAMEFCRRISRLSQERGRVLMFHDVGNEAGELNLDIDKFESILKIVDWGGGKNVE